MKRQLRVVAHLRLLRLLHQKNFRYDIVVLVGFLSHYGHVVFITTLRYLAERITKSVSSPLYDKHNKHAYSVTTVTDQCSFLDST